MYGVRRTTLADARQPTSATVGVVAYPGVGFDDWAPAAGGYLRGSRAWRTEPRFLVF